jgi:hypothetical protein
MLEECDSDAGLNDDILNYKGIYYENENNNDDEEEDNHEHEYGAHFKYRDLCKLLEKLYLTLPPDRRGRYVYANSDRSLSPSNIVLII